VNSEEVEEKKSDVTRGNGTSNSRTFKKDTIIIKENKAASTFK
jgi:hypothetical protein